MKNDNVKRIMFFLGVYIKMEFFSNERNNAIRVIKEATFVGILTALIGYVASALVKPYFNVDLPEICKSWNKKTMEFG
jgi:hypothetical protein